jgi:hypothetical protein
MPQLLRICLLLLPCGAALADSEPGIPVRYSGGTLIGCSAKPKARLYLPGPEALLLRCGTGEVSVAYEKIKRLAYGQEIHRRYGSAAPALLTPITWPVAAAVFLNKSRKHFVTIEYADPEGKAQAMIVRVEKDNIRSLLADLEARAGRPVEFEDREGRKPPKTGTPREPAAKK